MPLFSRGYVRRSAFALRTGALRCLQAETYLDHTRGNVEQLHVLTTKGFPMELTEPGSSRIVMIWREATVLTSKNLSSCPS